MAKTAPVKHSGPRVARGRFVSRSIATSEQLAAVPLLADYLFRACIPFLDVAGRMTGNPALIKSQVVPLRDEIDSRVLPELLRSLSAATDHEGIPLVFWYEINGIKVLEFPKFSAHQQGLRTDREAPSKLPPRNGMEKLLHLDGPTPAVGGSNSGVGPAQEKLKWKVNGSEDQLPPPPAGARASVAAESIPQSAKRDDVPEDEFAAVVGRLPSVQDARLFHLICQRAAVPLTFIAELGASLDGMAGHVKTTPEQAAKAIRDFVNNRLQHGGHGAQQGEPPKLASFRRHLEIAATEQPVVARPPSTNGAYSTGDFASDLDRAAQELIAEEEAAASGGKPRD